MTDAPVDTSDKESSREIWALLEQVLNLVKQLIKPNTGRYLTHFNGKSVPKLIEEYEHVLNKLTHHSCISLKSSFSRSESFVPSFQEVWIFYQLCMTETRWTVLLFLFIMHKYNNFYYHFSIDEILWRYEIKFEIFQVILGMFTRISFSLSIPIPAVSHIQRSITALVAIITTCQIWEYRLLVSHLMQVSFSTSFVLYRLPLSWEL